MSSPISAANLNMAQMSAQSVKEDRLLNEQKATPHERSEIKRVADEFESLFLNLVLKSMRQTVPKSDLINGGNAEDIYKSMLDDEYAKMMAQQRSTGIADNIEEFLLRAQGSTRPSPPQIPEKGLKAYQDEALRPATKQAKIKNGAVRAQ
jgi:flagellar protein FlgJ